MSFISLNIGDIFLSSVTKPVAIYEDAREVLTGNILMSSAIMSCSVTDDSKLMEHPIESGALVVDHKVINPVEITLRLCLPAYIYSSVYREIRRLYEDSVYLRIKTKAQWYTNMVLQALPHDETPETFDRLVFDLHFKEVLEVQPVYVKFQSKKLKNIENSDTQKLGDNLTNSSKKTSILADGLNALGGLF